MTDDKATYATINIVYNMKGDSEVLSHGRGQTRLQARSRPKLARSPFPVT